MNKFVRLVAWFEMLTGGFMMIDVVATHHAWTLSRGLFIAFGTLGLVAGIALFRFASNSAWWASLVLQLLQVPVFLIGTIIYRPGLGVFLPLGVNMPDIGFASALYELSIGVDFDIALRAFHEQQYVAVNFAALACLVILLRNRPAAGKRTKP